MFALLGEDSAPMREPKTIDLAPDEYRRLGERVQAVIAMPWWRRGLCLMLGLILLALGGMLLWGQVQAGHYWGYALVGSATLFFGAIACLGTGATGR